ncbi:MAG: hypothetical protein ACRYFX_18870 [Janthinobacterium lividum]
MKVIAHIGSQLRAALNEQRGFIDADDLSASIWQASNAVFGHYAGHQSLLRPGQPLPPDGYGINDPVNTALNPFLKQQVYVVGAPGPGQIAWTGVGFIPFPAAVDTLGNLVLEGSFQRPVALEYTGARSMRQVNENALARTKASRISAPSLLHPTRTPRPGGLLVLPYNAAGSPLTLTYLAAPPKCKYAEVPDPNNAFEMVYDDATSVDVGWIDVTAVNLIIAVATIYLGGQVKDQLAVSIAAQTIQRGA